MDGRIIGVLVLVFGEVLLGSSSTVWFGWELRIWFGLVWSGWEVRGVQGGLGLVGLDWVGKAGQGGTGQAVDII